ncbi:recombination factor protein RarA [Mycoplasmopsis canis UFG4]|uniref:Recombination factor protein RarA n=1 Tax=Mycoplasmopsis canis UFG4 TaxID=1131455 RepID=I1A5Q1_9BACT|nr:replication-associated recombination protein A [Mycoplasmopsis canis]EIE41822.1 recombination factor protein RarA [Mycoplasmopsis canis UFG4]
MISKNLANYLRPKSISEIIGQHHIKALLRSVIDKQIATSFIFFGESGIGKTSTAIALATEMKLSFGYFNASVGSKNELMNILENNEIVIIDEIHRLNKDKQEILLSYLEFDKIIVYATTTENPYFKVVPAIRSRMQILQFYKLEIPEIVKGLRKIVNNEFPELMISDSKLELLANYSSGDYRSSINNLQMLATLKTDYTDITEKDLKTIIPNINFYSDQNSSEHYNNLSAFHKSVRGSDIDAALYYGFLILASGDYDGLFRRMLALAYEDIGLANPQMGQRVLSAIEAFERLGMPEGELPIAYAIADLSLSPKSNSVYLAKEKVKDIILSQGKVFRIPNHLRDAHYNSASKLGDGIGYKYPHDFKNNWVPQMYLPKELREAKFYFNGNNKYENDLKKYWEIIKDNWKKQ